MPKNTKRQISTAATLIVLLTGSALNVATAQGTTGYNNVPAGGQTSTAGGSAPGVATPYSPGLTVDQNSMSPTAPSSVLYDPNQANEAYVLGPGDTLSVKVTPQDKYSVPIVSILQDGTFFYPHIGEINASGKTVGQLTDELRTKLAEYCINPDVAISVTALRAQVVYVSGGVMTPKVLDVHAASSVAKAITLAGGATERNTLSRVAVIRGSKVLNTNVYPLLINGVDNGQNIALMPGDLVVVPINTAKVTVLGAVDKPGSYSLQMANASSAEGPERLSDAIGMAGGADKHGGAKLSSVSVVRQVAGNAKPTVFRYDYGKYLKNGDNSYNPVLQDNDVVIVPEAGQKFNIGTLVSYVETFVLLRRL